MQPDQTTSAFEQSCGFFAVLYWFIINTEERSMKQNISVCVCVWEGEGGG